MKTDAAGTVNMPELKSTVSKMVALVASSSGAQGKSRGMASRAKIRDPFEMGRIKGIILPPISPEHWIRLANASNILPQLFRALEIGIEGHGHHYPEAKEIVGSEDEKKEAWKGIEKEMAAESAKPESERRADFIIANDMDELLDKEIEALERTFENFSSFESFIDIRRMLRNDKSTVGYWTLEILRDGLGRIYGGAHVPSYQVRLTEIDKEPTDYDYRFIGHDWTWQTQVRPEYFRRYVQVKGNITHWYKQYGDPRNYDYLSGALGTKEAPIANIASELIYCRSYVAGTDYGMPDWRGQAANVGSSVKLERMNYTNLANRMIPAMLMLVMGGDEITQGDLDRIFEQFNTTKGEEADNALMIVQLRSLMREAVGGGKVDSPQAVFQVLQQLQRQDAMFLKLDESNIRKLMSSGRIPPILLGMVNDYNLATASAAEKMFERYVGSPERNQFDFLMNRFIVLGLGVRFHTFESKGPDLTDWDTVARLGDVAARMGGVSIDGAIELGNRWLGLKVAPIGGEDGKLPLAMLIAKYQAQSMQFPVGLTAGGKQRGSVEDYLTHVFAHVSEQARRFRMEKKLVPAGAAAGGQPDGGQEGKR